MASDTYAVQDIRDNVRAFIEVDINDIPDFLIDGWLREGYRRIKAMSREWPWFEIGGKETPYTLTTVIGQATYDLPAVTVQAGQATVSAKGVRAIQGPHWELLYGDDQSLESTFTPDNPTLVQPERFSAWGTAGITLWPTPDAVYVLNVRAYRNAVDWVSLGAGGTVDGPEEWSHAVQTFALARASAQQTDLAGASYFQQEFEMSLKEIVQNEIHAPMAGPLVLNGARTTRALPSRLRYPWEGATALGRGL